jgi:ribosomal protein S18 acetylase RimI-like enzyme
VPIDVRLLHGEDTDLLATAAPDVFDDPLNPAAMREFLEDPRHHLAVAVDDGVVIGFASAVHYVHPDKPVPELWINEVGVADTHRGRGIGKALLAAMLEVAHRVGCREAWVVTDRSNHAAMRLYDAVGGIATTDHVMFTFRVGEDTKAR